METIAYLGPPGTYSEDAAHAYGGGQHGQFQLLPLNSIPAVVTALESGAATVGVLPIENLLEGSVTFTLDLLIHETSNALQISGETVIPIQQCLASKPGVNLSQIEVLYAHPQSLGQCRKFVERCLPGVATIASLSNSAAPSEALADQRNAAAITTLRAAALTGATIVAQNIADRHDNVTRFIALNRQSPQPSGDDKTSFCFGFTREDRAGTLVGAPPKRCSANMFSWSTSMVTAMIRMSHGRSNGSLLELDGSRFLAVTRAGAPSLRELALFRAIIRHANRFQLVGFSSSFSV